MPDQVPPYVVFSDKTLIDMCVKKAVESTSYAWGIGGEVKLERYGQQF